MPCVARSPPRPVACVVVGIDAHDGHPESDGSYGPDESGAYPGAVPEPDPYLRAPVERQRVWWGLGDAVVGWFIGLLGGFVTLAIVLALSGVDGDQIDTLPLGWVAVAQLGLWVGLLGVPYVAARFKGNGMVEDFGLSFRRSDLLVGGLAGLVGQFVILWIVYVPMSLLWDVTQEELSEPAQNFTDKATGPIGVVLLVLIVGIGAPIVEEIFYRGLLQRSLVRRIGVPAGVVVTSLIFGAVHFQWLQFPALALAGLLFGVLAERYGRLGPAIAAHMVFNLTAVVTLLATS
jgi:membrane protease YdiL (CAAX protease family)